MKIRVGDKEMEVETMMYLLIGNKLVPIARIVNGVPEIKATAEEIKRPDGTQDVIVHVPCLIAAKSELHEVNSKGE